MCSNCGINFAPKGDAAGAELNDAETQKIDRRPKEGEDGSVFEIFGQQEKITQSSSRHTVHFGSLAQSSRPAMQIFADAA